MAPWVNDDNVALLTDLYELTMLRAYRESAMVEPATFSLFARKLPERRNYLLACGLDDALDYLENVHFDSQSLDYLASLDQFSDEFLDWLKEFRFRGAVFAVPEGTPVFPDEPILEVEAALPEAQLAESFITNQVHFQTVLASKAARVVRAAAGRTVVDFGLRRMHGADAAIKAARAFHIAGLTATSNVLAGRLYGVPVTGTMAHSYVQAHDRELEAFRSFSRAYPQSILLVDTYDTLEGVRRVVRLAKELGDDFRIRGVRLDSGDLAGLAFEARAVLDEAGLEEVDVFASGGLDEDEIARIVDRGAPITGFGVGTGMGVSEDAPALDMAYKLTAYHGKGRLKLSSGKQILPGGKQVFRMERSGRAIQDVIARRDEELAGRPLLEKVMEDGRRSSNPRALDAIRDHARRELAKLPDSVQDLSEAEPPYHTEISDSLREYRERVTERVRG